MTEMSRFFVSREAVNGDCILITDTEDIKHMAKVLRLRAGDRIDVSDSAEFEYQTEIISMDASEVKVRILDKQKFAREPVLQATLYQGVPKQGKMEEIIQKSTELGVHSIVPVLTERSIVDDKKSVDKKADRWQKVAAEAVKQCRRGVIPAVGNAVNLKDAVSGFAGFDLVLFPYEDETEKNIKEVLRGLTIKPKKIAVVIGPEGGFSAEEAALVTEAGGVSVTLGKTILRTETAGPAALAMIMYELEI